MQSRCNFMRDLGGLCSSQRGSGSNQRPSIWLMARSPGASLVLVQLKKEGLCFGSVGDSNTPT